MEARQFTKAHSFKSSEIVKNERARNKYNSGTWISGTRFPAITPNEESFGATLFPKESITYTMELRSDLLPDYEVKVEGQLSRRHLFHFSRSVEELETYSRPVITAGLKALLNLDIHTQIEKFITELPNITPDSTLRDLERTSTIIDSLQAYLQDDLLSQITAIYQSTPQIDFHSYLKTLQAQYLKFLGMGCDKAREALDGKDIVKIQVTLQNLREHSMEWGKLENEFNVLLTRLGLTRQDIS